MKKWECIPDDLRTEEVRPYYDELKKHRAGLIVKRVFDFFMALFLIVLLSPVLIVLGILIGLTSPGGAFFCQRRVTTYGRVFKIYKFRTMVAGADKLGSQVTTKKDSRVTGIGRILRKVRLDELPQLFNIVKGDMSFVGTRPEVEKYVDAYTPEMMATLLMPAGVTSKASIEYKDEEKLLSAGGDVDKTYVEQVLPEKMRWNLEYVKNFSVWKDLKLMLQTVVAVLH